MGELLARNEIDRLIREAIADLETAAAARRMNRFVANLLGATANALGYPEIVSRVHSLLLTLTSEDFSRGSLTNIDWRRLNADELDSLRRIDPTSSFDGTHPLYDRNAAVPDLERFASAGRHIRCCLDGNVAAAVALANSEHEFEDIADTLAALGKYGEALALADSLPLSDERKCGVLHVALVEKCRRLAPDCFDEIARANLQDHYRLHVILALAGRRPWVGYPYSDY